MRIHVVTCSVQYEGKLNTDLAVGKRVILHKADGSVAVPEVLQDRLGKKVLEPAG